MADDFKNLHIVTVHGTFAGREYLDDHRAADQEFYCERSAFGKKLISELPGAHWHEFGWSGKNLQSSRAKAAKALKKHLKTLPLGPEDSLVMIAHSHGGNVALESLRQAPVGNSAQLYTFGTPFITRRSPSLLRTLGSIIPNLVFFFAVLTIAAIIGLGHSLYILYGIPFYDVTITPGLTRFFDVFNSYWAKPVAGILTLLAAFWLIIWPVIKSRHRNDFSYAGTDKFSLTRIWRRDDEAIALLNKPTEIAFPVRIFNSFFRFISAALLIGFVALSMRQGYRSLLHFRDAHNPEEAWSQILPFGAETIGLGLTVVLGVLLANFIIQLAFKKPLSWLLSRPVNNILRKSSIGEDGYARLDVSPRPNIPDGFVTELNETHSDIAPILEAIKTKSDQAMVQNKTEIMRLLATSDSSLIDILQKGELAKSLIHCNYFTDDMAVFLARKIKGH